MPPGVRADLDLVIEPALRGVRQIEAALTRSVQTFSSDMARALAGIRDETVKIDADARNVSQAINAATQAADTEVTVDASAQEVTGSINAAVEAANTEVTVTADTEGLEQVTSEATSAGDALGVAGVQAGALAGGVGNVKGAIAGLGVAFGAVQVVDFFRDAIQSASDLNESMNVSNVIFGDSVGIVNDFATGAADSIGLAESQARQLSAQLGGLFQAAGNTEEEMANLSAESLTAASDMASFFNAAGGTEEALTALRSALIGETEPIRRFNVVMNEAAVQAKAAELGLGGANRELTEGEKISARYAIIMEQLGNQGVLGDFARTAEGAANSQRRLSAQWEDAQAEIGQKLLPVYGELLNVGRDLIPQAVEFAGVLAEGLAPALSLVGDVMGIVAKVLDVLPVDLLVTAGAAIALSRALQAITAAASLRLWTGIAAGISGITAEAGKATVATGGLRAGLVGSVNPITAVVVGAAVGFSVLSERIGESSRKLDELGEAALQGSAEAIARIDLMRTEAETLRDRIDAISAGTIDPEFGLDPTRLRSELSGLTSELHEVEEAQLEFTAGMSKTELAQFRLTRAQAALSDALQDGNVTIAQRAVLEREVAVRQRDVALVTEQVNRATEEGNKLAREAIDAQGGHARALSETALQAVTFRDTLKEAMGDGADAVAEFGESGRVSLRKFTRQLERQIEDHRLWASRLAELSARGHDDLVNELLAMGAEGERIVRDLVGKTDAEISEFAALLGVRAQEGGKNFTRAFADALALMPLVASNNGKLTVREVADALGLTRKEAEKRVPQINHVLAQIGQEPIRLQVDLTAVDTALDTFEQRIASVKRIAAQETAQDVRRFEIEAGVSAQSVGGVSAQAAGRPRFFVPPTPTRAGTVNEEIRAWRRYVRELRDVRDELDKHPRKQRQVADAVREARQEIQDLRSALETARQAAADMRAGYVSALTDIAVTVGQGTARMVSGLSLSVEEMQRLGGALASFASSVESSFVSATGVVENFRAGVGPVTTEALLAFFDDSVAAASEWQKDLKELTAAGVDQSLLAELAQAGPEAQPLIDGLLQAVADGEVGAVNRAQEALRNILGSTTDFLGQRLLPLFKSSEVQGFRVAESIAEGFAQGSDAIVRAVRRAFRQALREAKKELGIASPSMEFYRIARQSAEGFELGFDPAAAVVAEAERVVSQAAAALGVIPVRVGAVGQFGSASPAGWGGTLQVFVTPHEGMTRVEAQQVGAAVGTTASRIIQQTVRGA